MVDSPDFITAGNTGFQNETERRLPPLTEKSKDLLRGFNELKESLPESESERLGIVIPARRAARFMKQNLPFLESQISECIAKDKIDGADVVVVLNRGGTEEDRTFAQNYEPTNMRKKIVYEHEGVLYEDQEFKKEYASDDKSDGAGSLTFIVQEDVDRNTGHSNALRTGFRTFVDEAKAMGHVKKYYLTTDTDNRLHTNIDEGEFVGNGLLGLMDIAEKEQCFAVGARVQPAVADSDGVYHTETKVSGLVRATANLHSKTKGFQWSPGGGTMARGRDALAAQTAINDRDMEVPDVSFTLLTRGILGKDIRVTGGVMVVDDAPTQEEVDLNKLKRLHSTFKEWSQKGGSLQEIITNPDIPSGWKKLTRWIQGQQYAEDFFGHDLMKLVAQPKLQHIILGNIQATMEKYGYSELAIKELVSLVKELPGYMIIKKSVGENVLRPKGNVSW